jgi:hypothetical protein
MIMLIMEPVYLADYFPALKYRLYNTSNMETYKLFRSLNLQQQHFSRTLNSVLFAFKMTTNQAEISGSLVGK